MQLSKNQIKHVAKLANLPLTSDEEKKYSEQLSEILDYIDQLNRVDTPGVATYNVSGLSNAMRKDEVGECLTREDAISNAANKKDGFFVTKGVFDNG